MLKNLPRTKKIIFTFLFLIQFFLYFSFWRLVRADDSCSTLTVDQCQQKKIELENKIRDLQGKEKTLKNEISLMDSRINVTIIKIQEAGNSIKLREEELLRLGADVNLLAGKMDILGKTLSEQKKVFSTRVATSYKNSHSSSLELFLGNSDFSYFMSRLKYLKIFEANDNKFLRQMEDTRQVFQTQKIILADKKDQVGQIKTQIEAQKKELEKYNILLSRQKVEKQNLLSLTSNDENKYQQLLSQVNVQLAAFKRFVNLQGGATILTGQTFCDGWGCYYNQRDAVWGTKPLGISNLSVAEYGCLVSSSVMIVSHYQKNLNPGDVANDPAAFFSPDTATAYLWKDITVSNVRIVRISLSPTTASIDGELSAGRPVIIGLYAGPAHFVVLKSGANGNYVMNDPFVENGHDISFTSKYPLSAITEVERVNVY